MTDIRDSVACMEMPNLTGYTQHLHDSMELGEVSEATITTMNETDSPTIGQMLEHGDTTHLRRVCQDENEEWRRKSESCSIRLYTWMHRSYCAQSVTKLRQFMGPSSYYRCFVKNFIQINQPLHASIRKGENYSWDESCQKAFDEL